MDKLLLTAILAVILMGLVVAALAIGLILTGKSRLKKGCGWRPSQDKDETTTCAICGEQKICEKKETTDDDSKPPPPKRD